MAATLKHTHTHKHTLSFSSLQAFEVLHTSATQDQDAWIISRRALVAFCSAET